MDSISERRTTW